MLKADAPLGFPNRTHPAQVSGELLPGGASAVGDLLAGHNGGDERGQDHRSGNTARITGRNTLLAMMEVAVRAAAAIRRFWESGQWFCFIINTSLSVG